MPLLEAMRPQEWVKNLLVFAGLLFSGALDQADQVLAATLTFVAFCAISSAGYLFNDLRDREQDRVHPDKRHRPIASGSLPAPTATAAAAALAVAGIGIGLAVEPEVGALVALYGAITAAYSLALKRLVIIDVMTIGSLFILRVIAGAVAVEAQASEFLLICTGFLALFLGFTKRRQEAMLEQATNVPPASSASPPGQTTNVPPASLASPPERITNVPPASSASPPGAAGSGEGSALASPEPLTRPVLEHYSLPFLDQMIAMVTAASIISYVIYAVNSPLVGSRMLVTAPSVLYGIFRYLYLIYDRRDTRSTAAILAKDPGIIFAAATWIGAAVLALYVLD